MQQPQPNRSNSGSQQQQQQSYNPYSKQRAEEEEAQRIAFEQDKRNREALLAAEEERKCAEEKAASVRDEGARVSSESSVDSHEMSETQKHQLILRRIEQVREALRPRLFALGQKKHLLAKLQVTEEVPLSLTEESKGKCQRMLKFLSQAKCAGIKPQAALTIHKTRVGAVIHVADSDGISVFIEVPSDVDPVEVARQLVKGLKTGLETALGDCDPITVFDGECRSLNFKKIFRTRNLLRTQSSEGNGLAQRINSLRAMTPITEETVAIVDGIPSNVLETNSVFGNAELASDWSGISEQWKQATSNTGFGYQLGTREEVLTALQSKKHVIILIAHGNTTELYLPSPPPNGSSVFINDLEAIKNEIQKNQPVVYMFCCESARFDGAQNWTTELLRHGARAVYAPQEKIETENTRDLYKSLLANGRGKDPITATHQAEKDSGCRELEMWVA